MENERAKFKDDFNQRLIRFSLDCIQLTAQVRKDRNLWPLADQLIRAATSIGANVIEARGSPTTKDYAHFFTIALKSANETRYWLLLIRETALDLQVVSHRLLSEVDEISRVIGASVLTMKNRK